VALVLALAEALALAVALAEALALEGALAEALALALMPALAEAEEPSSIPLPVTTAGWSTPSSPPEAPEPFAILLPPCWAKAPEANNIISAMHTATTSGTFLTRRTSFS
jgi:hypothetical protein